MILKCGVFLTFIGPTYFSFFFKFSFHLSSFSINEVIFICLLIRFCISIKYNFMYIALTYFIILTMSFKAKPFTHAYILTVISKVFSTVLSHPSIHHPFMHPFFQINAVGAESKFDKEIKEEQEEKRRKNEEARERKAAFKEKATLFQSH